MAEPSDAGRCVPCEDGRRLVIAAVAARLGWGLATARFAADAPAPWGWLALSALAPVPVYRLAVNLRLSRAAALAAGLMIVVHPGLVDAGTRGTPAAALPTLAAAALAAWVYAWQSGSPSAAALAGAFGGGAYLAGASAAPAALCLAVAAAVRRAEQPRWKILLAAALLVGALAAAPGLRARRAAVPTNKWSSALVVTPALGAEARLARVAFAAVLGLAGFFGLGRAARGPGGAFLLAALAAACAAQLKGGPGLLDEPGLSVLAGAGLGALGLLPD